ncbi:MAG: DUF4252 domain-containing protein [Bacteroidales bacterium]|nr:DUF4252 domain-containing protein [Bacteroidales bacterium]
MKKILLTLCMVLCLVPTAWAGNPAGIIRTLVNEFRDEPGFEVVDMGPVALGLIRAAARGEVKTEEDRKALQVFKDIKRLTVLDFSDAEASRKEKFLRKAKRVLAEEEMLMEAKDGGETVRVYGMSNAAGDILEDIIILAGDALISVRGKIRADLIGELVNQAEK